MVQVVLEVFVKKTTTASCPPAPEPISAETPSWSPRHVVLPGVVGGTGETTDLGGTVVDVTDLGGTVVEGEDKSRARVPTNDPVLHALKSPAPIKTAASQPRVRTASLRRMLLVDAPFRARSSILRRFGANQGLLTSGRPSRADRVVGERARGHLMGTTPDYR